MKQAFWTWLHQMFRFLFWKCMYFSTYLIKTVSHLHIWTYIFRKPKSLICVIVITSVCIQSEWMLYTSSSLEAYSMFDKSVTLAFPRQDILYSCSKQIINMNLHTDIDSYRMCMWCRATLLYHSRYFSLYLNILPFMEDCFSFTTSEATRAFPLLVSLCYSSRPCKVALVTPLW